MYHVVRAETLCSTHALQVLQSLLASVLTSHHSYLINEAHRLILMPYIRMQHLLIIHVLFQQIFM